ncbi:MAG: hypothetical protein LLG00_09400 [Planctomycetaceae bacterium]|nr:hypothetical protein [Planctomycetaceae bacterium]
MSKKKSAAGVLIGRDYWEIPVRIRLRAYLNFGRRMDGQLRRLVDQWSCTASPWARGVRREPLALQPATEEPERFEEE